MTRRRLVAGLMVCGFAGVGASSPSAAVAATVAVADGTVTVEDRVGETNDLSIATGAGGVILLRDTSTPLVVGDGCSPADGGAVTCAARDVKVNLEAGDDRAVVDPRVLGPVDGG